MKFQFQYVVLLTLLAGSGPALTYGQSDAEQIKAVIARETSSYMNVDYKSWAATWLQVPYAFWAYSDNETSRVLESWSTMNQSFADYFKNSKPSLGEITNDWIEIRVYETGAFVRFNQKVVDDFDTQLTSQVRVLEKKDGAWKIVCMKAAAKN